MALAIKTFSNATGGFAAFKALGHPLVAERGRALVERLKSEGPVAIYDPADHAGEFAALYDELNGVVIDGVYVQNLTDIGKPRLGRKAQAIAALKDSKARTLLVCAFDASPIVSAIRHLIPQGVSVVTFDELRLSDDMLTNKRHYLNTLNFATNFVLFRDEGGHHTRLVTANYWAGYGAKNVWLFCRLFDASGNVLADWRETLRDATHTITLDSSDIRARFNLPEFTGSLFVHAINVAGHDIVKYALDTYGDDDTVLSCTHDANAWPSELYAGLPAPKADETVLLWIQNSHPTPIPAGAVMLNEMGSDATVPFDHDVPPFATYALDVGQLMPTLKWPQQLEVRSGMHFVRPRYEVVNDNGRSRIAHINVERSDLKPDPEIPNLSALMGKGYILSAPIFPLDRYRSIALPTPMSTAQDTLPLTLVIYDADGTEICREFVGKLARKDSIAIDAGEVLARHNKTLPSGQGHMELIYDFSKGGSADGWLHGLFRYEDTQTGHAAETSFGAHIFNTPLVYKNEPQSYAGRPPGLTTRLFLRLGSYGTDTICALIYAASTPWHEKSQTDLLLYNRDGVEIAKRTVQINCSGSLLWRTSEQFSVDDLTRAGADAYVMIRDTTCRLFGYHGLVRDGKAFSFDHMFGF